MKKSKSTCTAKMPSSVHFCTTKVNTNLKQGRSWWENSFEGQKLLLFMPCTWNLNHSCHSLLLSSESYRLMQLTKSEAMRRRQESDNEGISLQESCDNLHPKQLYNQNERKIVTIRQTNRYILFGRRAHNHRFFLQ